jgi:4-amino-4-deoxy-L-arabinose transferase-like glycosyltransferase
MGVTRRVAVPGLLIALIGLGILIRAGLVVGTRDLGTPIVDEQHYVALARSVADGLGFAWGPNQPTSIRPPLYPFFVASIWTMTGTRSLEPVRWAQLILSVISILVVYRLGRAVFDQRSALVAAAAFALYPSLLYSGVLLLTETLFITLLLAFLLAFVHFEQTPTLAKAAATGLALGLAALTRSVLWPFVLIVAVLMWMAMRRQTDARLTTARRLTMIAALLFGYAAAVGPWSIRNTSLQGTFTVVDTMGGLNLLMGNYEHTPEDRMWDAVSLTGEKAWHHTLPADAPGGGRWTEGKKEKWAQRQAVAFMSAHPVTTLRRSVLKFADFWGLERDFVAGVQRGYYNPPTWLSVTGTLSITLAYILTAILGAIGICLARPSRHEHAILLAIVVFICAIHSIVFGHARYHLPLIPVLLLYGASAVTTGNWRRVFTIRPAAAVAVSLVLLLGIIWSREILVRDWDKIQSLLGAS